MAEQDTVCIMCGRHTAETRAICPACADSVKREALGQQTTLRRQAEKEIRRQGVNPDPSGGQTNP